MTNLTLTTCILLTAGSAMADPLEGSLTDAATGIPIEGAVVRVMGTNLEVTTDAQGNYAFDLPHGKYELELVANVGGEVQSSRMVNQYVPQFKEARAHVFTSYFLDMGVPRVPGSPGLPAGSGQLPSDAPDSIKLPTPNPAALTVTEPIPRKIRVGRRQNPENGCSNNPV
ncbi:MAG: carboxypeptidase regulatory-like domain-containing protein, partial [Myxococcota bacterium]|nr:carboxypeptidase regulatory-like domain-containing protein [Myxococcota bacterium]